MKSPRLNVSLPPEVVEVIEVIAKAQGVSQSAVIRDLLVESMPYLSRFAKVLQSAKQVEEQKRDAVRGVLDGAIKEAETAAAAMLGLMDRMSGAMQGSAQPESGGLPPRGGTRDKAARRRPLPPLANRGDENDR